jgi:ribosomal protein L20A (L18A)
MMKFIVQGEMRINGEKKPFVKELEAASEKRARELVCRKIGADHRLKESLIEIKSVERASP